jgi:hypothetical protein
MGEPGRKDVVVAVVGASAALGGFVLVFLGFLINAYRGYPADTAQSVKQRHRRAAWPVLGAFALCIGTIAAALCWLAIPGGTDLYRIVLVLFAAELASILGVAVFAAVRLLR